MRDGQRTDRQRKRAPRHQISTSHAMEPCMKRGSETFSFGSQRQSAKSSRYTGRRRRGPHRYTATASVRAARVAGTYV